MFYHVYGKPTADQPVVPLAPKLIDHDQLVELIGDWVRRTGGPPAGLIIADQFGRFYQLGPPGLFSPTIEPEC